MAITVPALDATTDIVDTDMLLVTHSDGTSEKISGSEINKRSKIIIASTTTVTGTPLKTGNAVRIYFTADVNGVNASTTLQINYNNQNYNVKVPKNGALENYVAINISNSPAVYKYIQANTLLELLYDGTQFIILGNPIIYSGIGFHIFANGVKRQNEIYKSWAGIGTVNGDFILLGSIPQSSGAVSYASLELVIFGSNSGLNYPVGRVFLEISSGSSANGFNIRGFTDLPIDKENIEFPKIVVYLEDNSYKLYLCQRYGYRRVSMLMSNLANAFTVGNFVEVSTPGGTEVFNSYTDPSKIKNIMDL